MAAEGPVSHRSVPGRRAWLIGLALVIAADLLFWRHEPGISLFLFCVLISSAILLAGKWQRFDRPRLAAAILALLSALPLIEAPSMAGLLAAGFGNAVLALVVAGSFPRTPQDLPAILARFGLLAPFRLLGDAVATMLWLGDGGLGGRAVRALAMWIVPLALAVVFLVLLTAANPLIEGALHAVNIDAALDVFRFWRLALWVFVLAIAWPFLVPVLLPPATASVRYGPHRPRPESVLFGRGAILRALVLFNALFAVQTVMDLAYLWGGLSLPDGMTYAGYAHRGAYPLVVTALLAAGFVLAAMRPDGPATQSPLIRGLVYAFIGQNVMLVVSSLLRLDLYVAVYTLTGLRVAAAIWMGLVAIGLLLILARIALGKSNKWLVAANLASLGLTLYACAWIDFSGLIARYNVEHSRELTGQGAVLDIGYLHRLGPAALPAIDRLLADADMSPSVEQVFRDLRHSLARTVETGARDWQGWTLRGARLDAYLASRFAQSGGEARTVATPH